MEQSYKEYKNKKQASFQKKVQVAVTSWTTHASHSTNSKIF